MSSPLELNKCKMAGFKYFKGNHMNNGIDILLLVAEAELGLVDIGYRKADLSSS